VSTNRQRVKPGSFKQLGLRNAAIAGVLGRAAGTPPPHLFTTLGRHRRLFRAWLRFGGALMPFGKLPRRETELVILRVAHNSACEYEWRHHEHLAVRSGLSDADVERVQADGTASDSAWTERQRLLLAAADEMHKERVIGDDLWGRLSEHFSDLELIELCMLIGHYEMLAMAIGSLGIQPDEVRRRGGADDASLAGRRVLITGAARGIGAAVAKRLHQGGAQLALAGIEPELLAEVARECGDAAVIECDVRDREQVEAAVQTAVEALGGLDVVIANAGIAAQLPVLGGDPEVFERTIEVNLLGVYYTLRAAAPHIAHPNGYALAISSLAAAIHPPLLGAYSAAKAGVEALADSMRGELALSGAKVGVAYFAELDTDMTRRGFGTEAAKMMDVQRFRRVTPLSAGVDAIERGVRKRSRRVYAPGWVGPLLPIRMIAQRVVDAVGAPGLDKALEIARSEHAPLTTEQPERAPAA
jgi:NAD(P)-dependent dehydrogenase (short-subunit alcohol dehydrogenase family)/alkylhydroperoxidase family enzyme